MKKRSRRMGHAGDPTRLVKPGVPPRGGVGEESREPLLSLLARSEREIVRGPGFTLDAVLLEARRLTEAP